MVMGKCSNSRVTTSPRVAWILSAAEHTVGSMPEVTVAAPEAPRRSAFTTVLGAALFGAAVGALIGAVTLVRKGLVAELWQQGNLADLLWVAGGAAVGAG